MTQCEKWTQRSWKGNTSPFSSVGPHPLVLGPFILPGHRGKVCTFVPGKERRTIGHSLNCNPRRTLRRLLQIKKVLIPPMSYMAAGICMEQNKVVCPLLVKVSESVLGWAIIRTCYQPFDLQPAASCCHVFWGHNCHHFALVTGFLFSYSVPFWCI